MSADFPFFTISCPRLLLQLTFLSLRLRFSIRGLCPSVRRSVRRSARYFRATNMAVFGSGNLSNDIIDNDKMSDDEVVASEVPRGTCFPPQSPILFSIPTFTFYSHFVYCNRFCLFLLHFLLPPRLSLRYCFTKKKTKARCYIQA